MRKFLVLCAALFCLSLTASAQDSTAAADAASPDSDPAAPVPASLIPADREPWQLGIGFQYMQFDVLNLKFHDLGYQADVTRFLSNRFGVEGMTVLGFGNTGAPSNLDAKSFFIGGGPHVSLFDSNHVEVWAHVIAGWERFRFTQTTTFGTNSHAAFMAGGGVDYKIAGGRLYWRVQGNYIGYNIGSGVSNNYDAGTGFVINF